MEEAVLLLGLAAVISVLTVVEEDLVDLGMANPYRRPLQLQQSKVVESRFHSSSSCGNPNQIRTLFLELL